MRTSTIAIKSVKIVHKIDDSPDTSELGKYTDTASDWAIDTQLGEYVAVLREQLDDWKPPARSREYRFFIPYAGGENPGTDNYQTYGLQDFSRAESLDSGEWSYIGVRAEAEIVVNGVCQTIRSSGCWGVESDSGDDYLTELADEELSQLRDTLETLGFSPESIDNAFVDCDKLP